MGKSSSGDKTLKVLPTDSDIRRHLRIKTLYGETFGGRPRDFSCVEDGIIMAIDDSGGSTVCEVTMGKKVSELIAELLTLAQEQYN